MTPLVAISAAQISKFTATMGNRIAANSADRSPCSLPDESMIHAQRHRPQQ